MTYDDFIDAVATVVLIGVGALTAVCIAAGLVVGITVFMTKRKK